MSQVTNNPMQSHRRFNPLTGEWVLVSPHRTQRPWQGQVESVASIGPAHDPNCYLCPGNRRANGDENPDYRTTHVFTNDFSALVPTVGEGAGVGEQDSLYRSQSVSGECRVICFSPRHNLTLAEMTAEETACVIDAWSRQTIELGRVHKWVQLFENKGAAMGCSNSHPHGQVWAGDFLPNEPAKEDRSQRAFFERHQEPLLLACARRELETGDRIVAANQHWVALVPYWAVWPFEVLLLPLIPLRGFAELTGSGREALADILRSILIRYDNLFETSFPYSMGWHGLPSQCAENPHWQLHAHFYPPLLRSATVKKFMVGYELLADPQRDITPEQAAARLREVAGVHYRTRQVPGAPSPIAGVTGGSG
jgi:UDPglucose--hexose-1-phosphate uridylyltransferase